MKRWVWAGIGLSVWLCVNTAHTFKIDPREAILEQALALGMERSELTILEFNYHKGLLGATVEARLGVGRAGEAQLVIRQGLPFTPWYVRKLHREH